MKYRKKPVVIDAWPVEDLLSDFTSGEQFLPEPVHAAWQQGVLDFSTDHLLVVTLEGVMAARHGWVLIRGVEGEFYPCEGIIFAKTYEEADDGD